MIKKNELLKSGDSIIRIFEMPRCKAIFEQYTESYPESWARKIVWAYRKLNNRGVPFYWSDIRALSGVKKKSFQTIVPYLEKYAEENTVGHIVALAGAANYQKI